VRRRERKFTRAGRADSRRRNLLSARDPQRAGTRNLPARCWTWSRPAPCYSLPPVSAVLPICPAALAASARCTSPSTTRPARPRYCHDRTVTSHSVRPSRTAGRLPLRASKTSTSLSAPTYRCSHRKGAQARLDAAIARSARMSGPMRTRARSPVTDERNRRGGVFTDKLAAMKDQPARGRRYRPLIALPVGAGIRRQFDMPCADCGHHAAVAFEGQHASGALRPGRSAGLGIADRPASVPRGRDACTRFDHLCPELARCLSTGVAVQWPDEPGLACSGPIRLAATACSPRHK